MPYIEDEQDFIERHGGCPVQVKPALWVLPDGASITNVGMGPTMRDPPTDPEALLFARRQYHDAKLDLAETAFKNLKAALMGQSALRFTWDEKALGQAPPGRGKVALLRLREIASQHRTALAEIEREIDALPSKQRERERAQQQREDEAEMNAHAARVLAQIEEVTL